MGSVTKADESAFVHDSFTKHHAVTNNATAVFSFVSTSIVHYTHHYIRWKRVRVSSVIPFSVVAVWSIQIDHVHILFGFVGALRNLRSKVLRFWFSSRRKRETKKKNKPVHTHTHTLTYTNDFGVSSLPPTTFGIFYPFFCFLIFYSLTTKLWRRLQKCVN